VTCCIPAECESPPAGEGRPEATEIDCGPSYPACNANNFITSYFRHSFFVADPSAFTGFRLNLGVLRDDGAVVYLNGTEVFRTNMDPGDITWDEEASSGVSGAAAETTFHPQSADPGLLVAGDNALAVEVHQVGASSSDVSFDLFLVATAWVLDETGAMLSWLEADLLNLGSKTDWIVAFWHHLPYSKGSHDSDAEFELIDMREKVLPILYERSVLIDGHYGSSGECAGGECILDGGDGNPDTDGAYQKTPGTAPHGGSVYVVAGSSGQLSGGDFDHPVMLELAPENAPNGRGLNALGSLVIDVDGTQLEARFLDAADPAAVRDRFVLAPEPAGLALLAAGIACIAGAARGRTRSRQG
jgi:hypothetical protein